MQITVAHSTVRTLRWSPLHTLQAPSSDKLSLSHKQYFNAQTLYPLLNCRHADLESSMLLLWLACQEEEQWCEDALLSTSYQAICCPLKHAGYLQTALGCNAKPLQVLYQLVGQHAAKLGGAEVCRSSSSSTQIDERASLDRRTGMTQWKGVIKAHDLAEHTMCSCVDTNTLSCRHYVCCRFRAR